MTTRPFFHRRGITLPDIERATSVNPASCKTVVQWVVERLNEQVPHLRGIGCVMVGGGMRSAEAFASLSLLRRHGWQFPIQLWHLSKREVDDRLREKLSALGVEFVDAALHGAMRGRHRMQGWSTKGYAVKHSPFRHVLLLDTDCAVQRDVSPLFASEEYLRHGLVLAPDIVRQLRDDQIFQQLEIERPATFVEAESGQLMVDKERNWKAVCLMEWMNGQHEHFYKFMHGDKDTWPLAWLKLGQPYSMLPPCRWQDDGMLHHWFDGEPFTHHATHAKRGGRYRPEVAALVQEYLS